MSAKGRGRESVPFDFYPTPAWCVDRLLDDCGLALTHADASILEPTVGDGAIVRAFRGWADRMCLCGEPEWTGVELRRVPETAAHVDVLVDGTDFRTWHPAEPAFDLAIGNPPYALAESIVRHALGMSDRAAFLLRVGFLGSAERVPFWRDFPDVALRVLPDRPSFDGEGTDSSTYAWFVWGCPGVKGVEVLEPTPATVRSSQKPGAIAVDPRQCALFGGDAA